VTASRLAAWLVTLVWMLTFLALFIWSGLAAA